MGTRPKPNHKNTKIGPKAQPKLDQAVEQSRIGVAMGLKIKDTFGSIYLDLSTGINTYEAMS